MDYKYMFLYETLVFRNLNIKIISLWLSQNIVVFKEIIQSLPDTG